MGAPKLMPEDLVEIRRRYAAGETQDVLATVYRVGQTTISRVVRGQHRDTARAVSYRSVDWSAVSDDERDERRRASRAAWVKRNPQKMDAARRAWKTRNRARVAVNGKRWRANNAAAIRDRRRARSAEDEQFRAGICDRAAVRRARKRGAFVERVYRRVVWRRDGGVCGICGLAADPAGWHLDHVVPLALGGEHSYANVQVSHPSCNLAKGGRTPSATAVSS